MAIAAMDCAANRFAFQLVEAIRNEFPGSKRADRLTVKSAPPNFGNPPGQPAGSPSNASIARA